MLCYMLSELWLPDLQETHQEVPGWLQGMGNRAPSFGGKRRGGGGGNRFGGQDFRRDHGGGHCKSSFALLQFSQPALPVTTLNIS